MSVERVWLPSCPSQDNHLFCSTGQKSLDCGVDLAREELAHLLVFRIGLILAANTADAFRICNQEDGPLLRKGYATR